MITALKSRFPNIQGPDVKDICYATQNRQEAVRNLVEQVDLLWWLALEIVQIPIA